MCYQRKSKSQSKNIIKPLLMRVYGFAIKNQLFPLCSRSRDEDVQRHDVFVLSASSVGADEDPDAELRERESRRGGEVHTDMELVLGLHEK